MWKPLLVTVGVVTVAMERRSVCVHRRSIQDRSSGMKASLVFVDSLSHLVWTCCLLKPLKFPYETFLSLIVGSRRYCSEDCLIIEERPLVGSLEVTVELGRILLVLPPIYPLASHGISGGYEKTGEVRIKLGADQRWKRRYVAHEFIANGLHMRLLVAPEEMSMGRRII
ncbi:unnamed protein product [Arabidopsis lyrata]|nr:unnamed protein product [Arabidopsis lyrata]